MLAEEEVLAEEEEDVSVEADFFERLFFLVEPALESAAEEELSADCGWLASADLVDFFFFEEVLLEESAACELSVASLFLVVFFFVEVSELACESVADESSVAFFFRFFFAVVSDCD